MDLIDNILEIADKVMKFFQMILDAIASVVDSMNQFYEMLMDFDSDIQKMTIACNSGTFKGLPINTAIGTFRYLVGDLAFYMIYISILIGCLFTIYKLVTKLLDAVDALILQISGRNCKSLISALLAGLKFK